MRSNVLESNFLRREIRQEKGNHEGSVPFSRYPIPQFASSKQQKNNVKNITTKKKF
jgi:hypothetical protein